MRHAVQRHRERAAPGVVDTGIAQLRVNLQHRLAHETRDIGREIPTVVFATAEQQALVRR